MGNPTVYVGSAYRADLTPGTHSRDVYYEISRLYQFGTPIVIGRSPKEMAATYGIPYIVGPGDAGINATVPSFHVVTFPYPTPTVELLDPHTHAVVASYPVSDDVPGGTIVGANWVDFNGVVHPDIDWAWDCSIEGYQNLGGTPVGTWDQQVIGYTGDGVAGRLIPTNFSLASGVVAIWIFTHTNAQFSFRHNAMTGTTLCTSPLTTNGGVMAFLSTGFTVTNFPADGANVNAVGTNYTALVVRDSTSDNRYIHVGEYHGDGTGSRAIPAVAQTWIPTEIWVMGRSGQVAYWTDQFPANTSFSLAVEVKSLTTQIIGQLVGQFQIGADNNVNNGTLQYYYTVFSIPLGNAIRNIFNHFKITGTGGAIQVTGLVMTPGLAWARQYVAGLPTSLWRGVPAFHTGTQSQVFEGALQAAGGITAFGAGTLDMGAAISSAGVDIMGTVAPAGPNTVIVGSPPNFVLVPFATSIATGPNGVSGPGACKITAPAGADGGQACAIGTSITPVV